MMKKAIYAQKKVKHTRSLKKFYETRPLIASSLALMLSAGSVHGDESILYAEDLFQSSKQTSEGIETITISGTTEVIDLTSNQIKKANIQSDINGGSLTIKNGTLEGNIGGQVLGSPSTKGLTVTFENAIMKGNIQTGWGQNDSDGNDFQRKDVIFKGKNNSDIVLEGDIISYGSGYGQSLDKNKGNHVVFETGSMKGNIYAKRDGYQRTGYNEVIFKGEGAKLEGNVGAFGGSSKGNVSSTNRVVFERSGSIQGKISADGFLQYQTFFLGKNEIIFKGNGTNTIEKIQSKTNDLDVVVAYTGINEILFDNQGTNIIKGNIIAADEWGNYYSGEGRESVNAITFNRGSSNTIEGNILAKSSKYEGNYSHKNIIIFNSGTLNAIKGKISTDNNADGKYSGQNTLTLNNATLTIENPVETNKVEITNESSANILTQQKGTSIINFTGEKAELILKQSSSDYQNSGTIYNKDSNSTTTLNFNAKEANILGNIINANGSTNLNLNASNVMLTGEIQGKDGTLNLSFSDNASLKVTKITTESNAVANLNIHNHQATLTGDLDIKGTLKLNFFDDAALNLEGNSLKIAKLETLGDAIINLSGQSRWSFSPAQKESFSTLEISEVTSAYKPITFLVHVNPEASSSISSSAKADRIVIEGNSSNLSTSKTHYLGVIANPYSVIGKELYKKGDFTNNIALATVKDTSGITLQATDSIAGFSLISYDFTTEKTNKEAKNGSGYTTYFLGSAKSKGASEANQQISASAMNINYDLYLANLNSLNKRMGELRNNPNSQGIWARAFNGMQTSNFALETQSIYTTIQAGYDYAFGFEGANNYLGFALSYANSLAETKHIQELDQSTKGLKQANSNAVEFAIYNAYVQDGASAETGWANGLYTDSILKFSYIASKLDLLGEVKTYDANNFAATFSQEVGYRFLLGKTKEWYIDPQVELAFGYLDQSDLDRTIKHAYGVSTLEGTRDSIFTLRSRLGSSFGYDFKNFIEQKKMSAKIYLGAYYVHDFITGGDVSIQDEHNVMVALSSLESTSRFVMNVGTNVAFENGAKLYFDFERSFGGKITTDYQINLGVRYSFGEGTYTPKPILTQEKETLQAPVKLESQNSK